MGTVGPRPAFEIGLTTYGVQPHSVSLGFPSVIGHPSSRLRLSVLLRGDSAELQRWLAASDRGRAWVGTLIILGAAGLFGAVVGSWRSPQQAGYTALKLPLILLLTGTGNALLNGLLAPLLGVELKLRQSMFAVLMSFVVAAIILAAFAPILVFLIWNLPSMSSDLAAQRTAFAILQLATVAAVASAGIAANLRLYQWLRKFAGSAPPAIRLLSAWLITNLLLGTQLTWIARPFFGHPNLEVRFFRPDAFNSNFFEAIAFNFGQLLSVPN